MRDRPTGLLTGAVWLASTVAPWALAPHPNFSESSITAAQRLALVVDLRLDELERYKDVEQGSDDWEEELVQAASASVQESTRESATASLTQLGTRPDLSIGARAAATLLASVALAELDREIEALHAVDATLSLFDASGTDYAETSGSLTVIRVTLMQQRAIRLLELGDKQRALEQVDLICEHVLNLDALEGFPTTRGIGWGSDTVQRDIFEAIQAHAKSVRVRLEGLGGETWRELVTSRPRWLDVRAERREMSSYKWFIRDSFEEQFQSIGRPQRFFTSDPISAPVEASLFAAELIGDDGAIVNRRELLGRLRILQSYSGDSEQLAIDGLRLLRQSGRHKTLRAALRWTRARGPNRALITSARDILRKRSNAQSAVDRCDLSVLNAAAEFMSDDECRQSVDIALRFRDQRFDAGISTSRLPQWSRDEETFRSLAQLLPGVTSHDDVARLVGDVINASGFTAEPLARSLANLAKTIAWDRVDDDTRVMWISWATERSGNTNENVAASAIFDSILGSLHTRSTIGRPQGTGFVARLVREAEDGATATEEEVARAVRICTDSLKSARSEVRSGSVSIGEYVESDLAVTLLLRYPDNRLWNELVDYLIDSQIPSSMKSPALDRLARARPALPPPQLEVLRSSWEQLSAFSPFDFFETRPSINFNAVALRFAIAYNLLDNQKALQLVLSLSGSASSDEKVEAARSLSAASPGTDLARSGIVLALQMSHDSNPVVCGESGKALVMLSTEGAQLEIIVARLKELLVADGLTVPVLLLQGLLSASPLSSRVLVERLSETLEWMSDHHPARHVRQRADRVLSSVMRRLP